MKRIVVLPDSQFDSHDKKLHSLFVKFIAEIQPDSVIHVGDFLDCKAPARWSKATAEEFAGTLQGEIDAANDWLWDLRSKYDGPIHIKEGNHDQRISTYLRKEAPALASLRDLRIERLLDLEELGIQWHSKFIEFAPGWVVAHGHEGALRHAAGATALALAKKIGKSVICGHTHRAGMISESTGYGGKVTTLTGLEVGHAMDLRRASYLATGSANWQRALAVLYVDGSKVTPNLILVRPDGSFVFEGVVWR